MCLIAFIEGWPRDKIIEEQRQELEDLHRERNNLAAECHRLKTAATPDSEVVANLRNEIAELRDQMGRQGRTRKQHHMTARSVRAEGGAGSGSGSGKGSGRGACECHCADSRTCVLLRATARMRHLLRPHFDATVVPFVIPSFLCA
jgi:hypothetical protein